MIRALALLMICTACSGKPPSTAAFLPVCIAFCEIAVGAINESTGTAATGGGTAQSASPGATAAPDAAAAPQAGAGQARGPPG